MPKQKVYKYMYQILVKEKGYSATRQMMILANSDQEFIQRLQVHWRWQYFKDLWFDDDHKLYCYQYDNIGREIYYDKDGNKRRRIRGIKLGNVDFKKLWRMYKNERTN